MIEIAPSIQLDEGEFEFVFIRSPGPGGQNVNKVSSAVQLRFNLRDSATLPEEVKERLIKLVGRRITSQGVIIIESRKYRSQEQNRRAAIERLVGLIRMAVVPPKKRQKTRPKNAAMVRRLEAKHRRSELKRMRHRVED